ncbi:MAG: HNH endonuclease [Gammaproteobacteria bacterium]|nr:HNH endonuclease [Gammaproteobacteria bacterium]MBK9427168.1 HNH endonuclease [Gammaproteobacteria bacterium]
MPRPNIPADLRRAVLVEAGHRCAIPQCRYPEVEVHHIIPWESCKTHEYENLISLCPNCHSRADRGEIDRPSLRLYKAKLVSSFPTTETRTFEYPAVEIKRKITDNENVGIAAGFDFEFPDFPDPAARIVSRTIECWGNELLLQYTPAKSASYDDLDWDRNLFVWLRGRYEIERRDKYVISVQYTVELFPYRAAHRATEIRVQNFLISPFLPLTLAQILIPINGIVELAKQSQAALREIYSDPSRDFDSPGLDAKEENYELFTIGTEGMSFHFSDYQVGSYAEGRPTVFLPYSSLESVVRKEILDVVVQRDDI